jgi:hypothetical protein
MALAMSGAGGLRLTTHRRTPNIGCMIGRVIGSSHD